MIIRKYSEHGLGHLLNPTDPEDASRDWMRELWQLIVLEALGQPVEEPAWLERPAVSRITISSPSLMRPFARSEKGTPYAERVKPFNFILSVQVAPLGHPPEVDPKHFHLVAPYTTDPRRWLEMLWTDAYSGRHYLVTVRNAGSTTRVRVKSYRDVLDYYRMHSELKSAAPDGSPCDRTTVGLLRRRPVCPLWVTHIGKESNRLEDVEYGLVHALDDVLEEYVDCSNDPLDAVIPILKQIPAPEIAEATGLSEGAVRKIRNQKRRPEARNRRALLRFVKEHPTTVLSTASHSPT